MTDETASVGTAVKTDFDHWLATEYANGDPRGFTALAILVKIKKKDVEPLCSTYMHVIGTEADWSDITTMFAGSGMRWDAAVFFPVRDSRHGGPLDNPTARLHLQFQETRITQDRLAINQGHFFDAWGRRLKVEEVGTG
jgi:hypothetical protein